MTQDDFQTQVLRKLDKLDKLEKDVEGLAKDVESLARDTERLSKETERSSDRFSNYQQATQSLVNLAFGLIASATVITVVSAVFKR